MVDTSSSGGSSSCNNSTTSASCENQSSRIKFARAKKRQRRKRSRRDTDTIDDIIHRSSTIADDGDDNDDDDQKISSTTSCTLGPYDVICGRSKTAFNNVGNRRFRFTIALALPRFLNTKSRKEKSIVIESIKKLVHQNGGKFLMMLNDDEEHILRDAAVVGSVDLNNNNNSNNSNSTEWTELDAKQSHLKVGHALRDAERKLSKARKQQQKQHRQQQQQQQQQNNETETGIAPIDPPLDGTFDNHSLFNDVQISDPLLLDQSHSWDVDADEYDVASISTISYNAVGDLSTSHIHPKSQSLHPSASPLQSTTTSNVAEQSKVTEQLLVETTSPYHPNLYQLQQEHRINTPQYRSHSRPMQHTTDTTTYSAIQRPVLLSNCATMEMNDDNSYLPISWTDNRHLTNDRVLPQPGGRTDRMMHNDYPCRRKATPISDDTKALSAQNTYDQHVQHVDDDDDHHHQYIMSWLVDESEDLLDDSKFTRRTRCRNHVTAIYSITQ